MQSYGFVDSDRSGRSTFGGPSDTVIVGLMVAAAIAVSVGFSNAAEHPALVDPEQTNCTTCHDDVVAVAVPHPPAADDCLSCHSFGREAETTTVELMETGSALCLACHDDYSGVAEGSVSSPHAPVVDDCAACHDPHGTEHEALLVTTLGAICMECHDSADTDGLHPIPVSRADCRSCHEAHGSDLPHMLGGVSQHTPFQEGSCEACHRKPRGTRVRVLQEGSALCEACHGDLSDPGDGLVVHTAVRQGRCVECHDPHLADRPALLRAGGGELCFTCHPEIAARAQGPGAHAALEDGCDSCHDAHQSERRAMLLDDADELCRACHDPSDPELGRKHFAADMTTVGCGGCHDPHGSASMPLIANGSIHEPFREGCSTCHDGSAAVLVESGNALCETCHDDIAETASTAAVPHAAMEMAECVDCYSPHASRQPKLLRASGGELCLDCHEDQAGKKGDTVHRAITWIGCHSCHLPHGGAEEHLLRATGNDLCNGCHLQRRVTTRSDGSIRLDGGFVLSGERAESLEVIDLDPFERMNHPIPEHPVSGVIEGKGRSDVAKSLAGQEMSCRLCHEPHAAKSPQLFTWEATTQSELCLACHPK